MKTEKDIRSFMQEHRPEVPDGGQFMDNIVRQIDLLPVPAAIEKVDSRRQQEELNVVKDMFKIVKRQYRKRAFLITVLVVAISSVLAAMVPFFFGSLSVPAENPVDAFAFLPSAATLVSTFLYFLVALFAVVFVTMAGRKSLV